MPNLYSNYANKISVDISNILKITTPDNIVTLDKKDKIIIIDTFATSYEEVYNNDDENMTKITNTKVNTEYQMQLNVYDLLLINNSYRHGITNINNIVIDHDSSIYDLYSFTIKSDLLEMYLVKKTTEDRNKKDEFSELYKDTEYVLKITLHPYKELLTYINELKEKYEF